MFSTRIMVKLNITTHYRVATKVMIGASICHVNEIQLIFHFLTSKVFIGFTVEEVLPGLNTVFSVLIPDSGKAELQYLRDYVGFSAGLGLKANSRRGFDPIANISGVIGSTFISLGADVGIDVTKQKLDEFSAGFSLNSAFLVASLTMSDDFDSVKASLYHPLNPPTRTAIAAELKHSMSEEASTLTLGAQHALLPFTLVKARMNTDGKVSGVLRQEIWQKLYVSVSGELDLRDHNSIPRIGLSMGVKH